MTLRIIFCLIRIIRVLIECITRTIFTIIYRHTKHKQLPKVTNLLILESATALSAKIRDGKVTSEDVVRAFIQRIEAINPILNCVVDTCFDEAIREAKDVDKLLSQGSMEKEALVQSKPFLGVPFTTKDCMQVKGLRQTAGLYSRRDVVADGDADVVALLKGAGAIILGVTNVSEMCLWWESSNNVYGRTNNPYDTNRTVGGSSGGEACLQAACGAPIGIGSDIGGSIRMPAFFNGIFGHKPSSGVVSNAGQEPVAVGTLQQMLATGPLTRHACDLRPLVRVMAASNAALLSLHVKTPLKQMRVFYIEDDCGSCFTTPLCPELRASMRSVISHLQLAHGVTAVKVEMKELRNAPLMYLAKLGSEKQAATFAQELALKQGSISVAAEVAKWSIGASKHTTAALMLCVVEKLNFEQDSRKVELIAMADRVKAALKDKLGEDGVLLFPSHPTLAPYHSQPLFRPFNYAYTAVFNMMGFPVTQCPLGLSKDNLPLGIQVVGNQHQDHLCLSVAEELERAFGGWVCPSVVE